MHEQAFTRRAEARNAPADVARVIYASQASIEGPVYAEMERIRASAMRNNPPLGVFTALLFQSGWFVQWKEGPQDAVRQTMDRVGRDRRHHSIRTIHSSKGPRLLDGPWSMAIVQTSEDPALMGRRVLEMRRAMDEGVVYSPPAVWRRLSTPVAPGATSPMSDPDAFQRVLVCASTGSASFEWVRWLSRHANRPVVHRRFAGARDLDVGTDLVDFKYEGRTVRLVAMARKGLALPLTRAFMPDYSHVILQFSGKPERDLELVQKVAEACMGMASPPLLLGVAEEEGMHAEPAALARTLGLAYRQCIADPRHHGTAWTQVAPLLDDWHAAATHSGTMLRARVG